MSTQARSEYIALLRKRYHFSSREIRRQILTELCTNLNIHRKHAIRLMNRSRFAVKMRRGRKQLYSKESFYYLSRLWHEMGQMGSKKMKAALPEWISFYQASGFNESIKAEILKMSSSTIDRNLKRYRAQAKRKRQTGTKPGNPLLKKMIPLKTFDWMVSEPGHTEMDTVAHCGYSMSGLFVWSLTITDVYTGWTSNGSMWGKYGQGVVDIVSRIEQNLPFKILSASVDNGNEFLNHALIANFGDKQLRGQNTIKIQRGRPYRKNDQCYVEQKNYTHVRELFGYERFDRKVLVFLMNDIYQNEWNELQNFFIPQIKLIQKTRVGSKYKRKYSKPITPYQRILNCDTVPARTKEELKNKYQTLNPFELRRKLEKKLKQVQEIIKSTEYTTNKE